MSVVIIINSIKIDFLLAVLKLFFAALKNTVVEWKETTAAKGNECVHA